MTVLIRMPHQRSSPDDLREALQGFLQRADVACEAEEATAGIRGRFQPLLRPPSRDRKRPGTGQAVEKKRGEMEYGVEKRLEMRRVSRQQMARFRRFSPCLRLPGDFFSSLTGYGLDEFAVSRPAPDRMRSHW